MAKTTPSGRNPEDALARLTLKGADRWSPARRRQVADWLRTCAKRLPKEADQYAPRYVARFFVER